MKSLIWISYDLGLKGDYEGLYSWLDLHGAKECGDSVGFVSYEWKTNLFLELQKDIKKSVKITPKNRIYVIIPSDNSSKKYIGKFLFGNRKASPWEGSAIKRVISDEFDG
mgnify:CR=1 FL=1